MWKRWGQYIKLLQIRAEGGETCGRGLWAHDEEVHEGKRGSVEHGCAMIERLSSVVSDLSLMFGHKRSMMAGWGNGVGGVWERGRESVSVCVCVRRFKGFEILFAWFVEETYHSTLDLCHHSLQFNLIAINIQLRIFPHCLFEHGGCAHVQAAFVRSNPIMYIICYMFFFFFIGSLFLLLSLLTRKPTWRACEWSGIT